MQDFFSFPLLPILESSRECLQEVQMALAHPTHSLSLFRFFPVFMRGWVYMDLSILQNSLPIGVSAFIEDAVGDLMMSSTSVMRNVSRRINLK